MKFHFNLIESICKVQTWKTILRTVYGNNIDLFLMLEMTNMLDLGEIHCNMRKSTPQNTGKITWFSCSWELPEGPHCDVITMVTKQYFREVKGHICHRKVALHLGRFSLLLSTKKIKRHKNILQNKTRHLFKRVCTINFKRLKECQL